jgi:hypothetical protein
MPSLSHGDGKEFRAKGTAFSYESNRTDFDAAACEPRTDPSKENRDRALEPR